MTNKLRCSPRRKKVLLALHCLAKHHTDIQKLHCSLKTQYPAGFALPIIILQDKTSISRFVRVHLQVQSSATLQCNLDQEECKTSRFERLKRKQQHCSHKTTCWLRTALPIIVLTLTTSLSSFLKDESVCWFANWNKNGWRKRPSRTLHGFRCRHALSAWETSCWRVYGKRVHTLATFGWTAKWLRLRAWPAPAARISARSGRRWWPCDFPQCSNSLISCLCRRVCVEKMCGYVRETHKCARTRQRLPCARTFVHVYACA